MSSRPEPAAAPVVVTPAVLKEHPLPEPGGGKDSRGQVVVVAGTAFTPGAALLAAEAALRAGAGKLTVMTCESTAVQLAIALPEAMVVPLPSTQTGHPAPAAVDEVLSRVDGADALLVGCGFFDADETLSFLRSLLPRTRTPLVVDATASAYLGDEPDGLRHLEGRVVLTVNPGELALTAGCSDEEVASDPASVARGVADGSQVVVLCGGRDKYVLTPDNRSWVFTGGGPGLGVSGSGDVQAGVVAGLFARGCDAAQAAVWAAYVHGRGGERLAAEIGPVGSLAREQTRMVPTVLTEIH
jgi:ADP-dependent NAD(P)H-hydrate dehydratase